MMAVAGIKIDASTFLWLLPILIHNSNTCQGLLWLLILLLGRLLYRQQQQQTNNRHHAATGAVSQRLHVLLIAEYQEKQDRYDASPGTNHLADLRL